MRSEMFLSPVESLASHVQEDPPQATHLGGRPRRLLIGHPAIGARANVCVERKGEATAQDTQMRWANAGDGDFPHGHLDLLGPGFEEMDDLVVRHERGAELALGRDAQDYR